MSKRNGKRAATYPVVSPLPEGGWKSTAQMALEYGRDARTIQRWATDGTALCFGFRLWRDGTGRWWFQLPEQKA